MMTALKYIKLRTKLPLYTLMALTVVLYSSCKKYLDKTSNTSLVVPSTVKDLQALLDYPENINYRTVAMGISACDDYFIHDNGYNLLTGSLHIYASLYEWDANAVYYYPNDWAYAYLPIYIANLSLERIEHVPKTSTNIDQWNNVKGTALFTRAFRFLDLAWVYCKAFDLGTAATDMGIVLRLNSDFNEVSVRSSVKATYDRIIEDAKQAAIYLPDLPQHVMRPSKAAAYGLLARTYLSTRQYDSAYKYSNLVLSIKNDLMDYNDPSEVNITNNTPFVRFNKETVYYALANGSSLTNSSIVMIDTILYNSYQENDLRKTAFFRPSGNYFRTKNLYSGNSSVFTGISTDELYLVRAECLARLGNIEAAKDDLNFLLEKRYIAGTFSPISISNPAGLLEIILLERRKELILRGLRWTDIKRLNKEGANIIPTRKVNGELFALPVDDSRYALPLPTDIVEQFGITQN